MKRSLITFVLGCAVAGAASASCYTVLDSRGNIVYRVAEPPVNMSYQLHQVVPQRFGNGSMMVFALERTACAAMGAEVGRRGGPAAVDEVVSNLAARYERPGALPSTAFISSRDRELP